MRAELIRGLLAWVALGVAGCSSGHPDGVTDAPDGMVALNGRGLAIHCWAGPGPTVVIDAGLGESSGEWQGIAEELGTRVSVCTFDRAGYGGSDPGPLPRSPQANARDLRNLLNAAQLRGPFVLVGHSLGGLNAQAFFTGYREEVAGLVLLDPPPRAWLERTRFAGLWEMAVAAGEELLSGAAQARERGSAEAASLEAMASEHSAMLSIGAEVVAIESFGDLPLLVVAAGRPNPAFGDSAAAYQEFWIEENQKLANRSSAGGFEVLDSIGHGMNREVPGVIASLILGFLERM